MSQAITKRRSRSGLVSLAEALGDCYTQSIIGIADNDDQGLISFQACQVYVRVLEM
ncbi:hypothetical protein EMIT0196P_20118 [Pseudomonas chlororaphis]